KVRRSPFGELGAAHPAQGLTDRRSVRGILESFYARSKPDGHRQGMLAPNQSASLRALQGQRAEIIHPNATEAAFRHGIASRRMAVTHLPTLPTAPYASYFVALDRPLLIKEYPHSHLNLFIDSHIESWNSFVKILIDNVNAGDNDGEWGSSFSTEFDFYFMW